MSDERMPWDRRDDETPRAYDAFRAYRDLGPLRTLAAVDAPHTSTNRWSNRYDWGARAVAWDDAAHQLADRTRLEAIRTMHEQHAQAGHMIMAKALRALAALPIEEIPAYAAARLVELGARLERDTLIVSVEELQGASSSTAVVDPWEQIARELSGAD